jgi:hypothetical protein
MKFYEAFGGILQSDLPFPELRETAAQRADWTLRIAGSAPTDPDGALLGAEQIAGGVVGRLSQRGERFRLCFDDTGIFDLTAKGSRITWWPAPDATPEIVRADMLGRVLAVAFHIGGDLTLHGSAIGIDGRGVAFVGAKGLGKSTLAMALRTAGAQVLADDTIRLTSETPAIAPGVRTLRLRLDAAARFGIAGPATLPGDKVPVHDGGVAPVAARTPLAAVYVLVPRRAGEISSTVRRQLPSMEATLTLVQHGKSAGLLGGSEAGVALRRASTVARRAAVYALEIPRELSAVNAAAAQLIAWHTTMPAGVAGAQAG